MSMHMYALAVKCGLSARSGYETAAEPAVASGARIVASSLGAVEHGEPMTPAEVLADAIEAHRDHKYHGQIVSDPLDLTLYGAAVWFRTWQDHAEDPDAPILDE